MFLVYFVGVLPGMLTAGQAVRHPHVVWMSPSVGGQHVDQATGHSRRRPVVA